MHLRNSQGFTLIEVLIVVIIMAVLAATIIPQFASSTTDAKASALEYNLRVMREQMELYRMEHLKNLPTISVNGLPQLTEATNDAGEIGASGDDYPYGPYVSSELPENSFDGSNKVTAVAAPGEKPGAVVGALGGWQYDETTGGIWPNNAQYYE